MAVIAQAGIRFQLARPWQDSKKTERRLKNRKETPKLCPLCNPQARPPTIEPE
jgi:hypothetical protein